MKMKITTASIPSDAMADPFAGGQPPHVSNRIREYRKISNWENYFLCSAICSVGKSLGVAIDDYHFYAAFTGDMFTYLYSEKVGNPDGSQCDSGVTNSFIDPLAVKKAFAAMGYECIYLSNAQIKKDFRAAMNAIKASVDKGIPVVAWGIGNVTLRDGSRYDPLGEGCLIGGYDGDTLYVNLYTGPERLPEGSVDADGYSAIVNGLDTTNGLFFVGKKIENQDRRQVYQDAINSIPAFLTLPPSQSYEVNNDKEKFVAGKHRYVFGKQAFETWAATLLADEYFEGKTDEELGGICWNLHCSPYCCVCTSTAYEWMKKVAEDYPDMAMVAKLVPLYKKMQDHKDEIWALSGGFYPPMDKFRTHEFRAQIAEVLRRMGGICDEIVQAFEKE
ncbi:MAG: hypothetical protein FWE88_05285 [Phycisphaerae bacterium]|nr:hypothetical protein [Phycisphaerae bacterium]